MHIFEVEQLRPKGVVAGASRSKLEGPEAGSVAFCSAESGPQLSSRVRPNSRSSSRTNRRTCGPSPSEIVIAFVAGNLGRDVLGTAGVQDVVEGERHSEGPTGQVCQERHPWLVFGVEGGA